MGKLMTVNVSTYYKTFIHVLESTLFTHNGSILALQEWIEILISQLMEIKANDGTLYFIGNGASASMSSHFATDYTKNANINATAITDPSLITCFSNDFSYADLYAEILKRKIRQNDGLVVISSSGSSANVVNAIMMVNEKFPSLPVISFSGFNECNPSHKASTFGCFVNNKEYGFVESAHSYFLHMVIDLFIEKTCNNN